MQGNWLRKNKNLPINWEGDEVQFLEIGNTKKTYLKDQCRFQADRTLLYQV